MLTCDLAWWGRSVSRAIRINPRSMVGAVLALLFLGNISIRAQSTFVIEAEDFNHGSGQHITAASQMPYLGGAYNGLGATANVDYFQPADDGSSPEYRIGETPNVPMTQNADMDRGTWTMNTNYRIGWTDVGDSGRDALIRWDALPMGAPKYGVGAGVGLFYDILRVDVARGLSTGGRWELIIEANPGFWDFL